MEWVETTGKTIAEATEQALDQLGVDERDAEIVVVEESRTGFLGIGRSDARIRARVRPAAPRQKRPQRARRSRSDSGPRRSTSDGAKSPSFDGDKVESDSASVKVSSDNRGNRRPRSESRNRERVPAGDRVSEENPMSIEQQSESVQQFVAGVVERFGLDAQTTARIEDGEIFIEVEGSELGLLVGPRGATLDSLQELARTVIQRRSEEHAARVTVDVAGFRARRTAALEGFVRRVAEEVVASGTAQALEPMAAADRKIVHDTVNDLDGVVTTSEGVDPRRYVLIRPEGPADETSSPDEE
jgi:spoIIIJ-associated protein